MGRGATRGRVGLEDALRRDREDALPGLDVSRETLMRLDAYVDLLVKWQSALNLIAPSTLPAIWSRHVLDSAQIAEIGAAHRSWADLGSGAGFPGLVVALLLDDPRIRQNRAPGVVHLVESDQRKASFLREAIRVTKAGAIVHACRVEEARGRLAGRVTAVTARALAPLRELLLLAEPLLTTRADGFFPKGQALDSELELAATHFLFDSQIVPSRTSKEGRVLVVSNLRRRGPLRECHDEP